jgi:hypothetical protein
LINTKVTGKVTLLTERASYYLYYFLAWGNPFSLRLSPEAVGERRRFSSQVISQECFQDTGERFNLSQQYFPPAMAHEKLTPLQMKKERGDTGRDNEQV